MNVCLFDVLVVLLTLFELNSEENALFTPGTCPKCPRPSFQNMLLILLEGDKRFSILFTEPAISQHCSNRPSNVSSMQMQSDVQ